MVPARRMTVSPAWLQIALVTFAIGFGIMGYLAYRVDADQPPLPASFVGPGGADVLTREEIEHRKRPSEVPTGEASESLVQAS